MIEMIIGVLIFMAGFMACYFFVKKPESKKDEKVNAAIRRVKPSMRNPMRTYDIYYENYKSRDNQLYEPVKPRKKRTINEVSTDED